MQEPWEIHWKDYYEILGLDKNASEKSLKKKYRKLAREFHPDTNNTPEAEEKFKDISEAYNILNDAEKRKRYDQAWENHKSNKAAEENTENTNNENINYEDIEKNFTEEEKRYAKVLALKKLIEEELNKTEIILNTKNDLLIAGYNGEYEKREYYSKVKELVSIANEFIFNLIKLKEEAYKYDLLQEEEIINGTIEFLEEEIKNIPLTPKQAKTSIEKELYNEFILDKINEEINTSNEIIEKLKSVLLYVDNHQITHLDYNEITNYILLEGKNSLGKLNKLLKTAENLNLEEKVNILINQIKKLNAKLYTMPKTYEDAKIVSAYIVIEKELEEVYDKSNKLLEKIVRIIKLLNKYPLSNYCDRLIEYSTNALTETIKEIVNILQNKDITLKNIEKNRKRKIEEVEKISKEAVKLYEKAEDIHIKAKNIYNDKEFYYAEDKPFYALCDSAISTWDKNEAFKMLVKANIIKEILKSLDPNYDLNDLVEKLQSKREELERMLYSINNIKEDIIRKRKEKEAKSYKSYGTRRSRNNNGLIEELNKLKIELANYKKLLKKDLIKTSAAIPVFYFDSMKERITPDFVYDISMTALSLISMSGMVGFTYRFIKHDPISKLRKISEIEQELKLKRK